MALRRACFPHEQGVWMIGVMLCGSFHLTTAPSTQAGTPPRRTATLQAAARGLFDVGVGLNDRIAESPDDWKLLTTQFGSVTPENCMKPAAVQRAAGTFDFRQPDQFVDFAAKHHLQIVGHCLVWAKDDRTPAWFYLDGDKPASRELLLRRMKQHIDTVVGRYRGRITSWDVVNEAIDDGEHDLQRLRMGHGLRRRVPRESVRVCSCRGSGRVADLQRLQQRVAGQTGEDDPPDVGRSRNAAIRCTPWDCKGTMNSTNSSQDLEATLVAAGAGREAGDFRAGHRRRTAQSLVGGRGQVPGELAKYDPYRGGCPPEILAAGGTVRTVVSARSPDAQT